MARRKRATFKLSKQTPLSISQRTRRILRWLGGLVGVLLVVCIISYTVLMSWLQGDGFRQYLRTTLRQACGAEEVSIPDNLVIEGGHMTLPECTLHGALGVRSLSLRKLHFEINRSALLRRWLQFHHLSVEEMQITLGGAASTPRTKAPAPAPKQPQPATPMPPDPAPAAAPAPAAGSPAQQIAADIPHQVTPGGGFLKGIQAPAFESHYTVTTLIVGGGEAERSFSLSGYHLSASPKRVAGRDSWELTLENGRILTPFSWLRESGMKSAKIHYSGDSVHLKDARVLLTPGELRATATYRPSDGQWEATANLDRADVARILNDDWRKRLTGSLQGDLHFSGCYPGAWQAKGKMRLDNGLLEGLPILSDIKLNGTQPYRSLTLEKATCTIAFPYSDPQLNISDAWLWDNIDIRSAGGSLLIRGRVITGSDGSLSGALDVGIPTKIVAELGLSKTPALSQLFRTGVHVPGYMWVHVNLSGTLSAPQEDLSVRLATLLPQALPGMADQAVKSLGSVLSSFLPDKELPAAAGEDNNKSKADESSEPAPRPSTSEPTRQIRNAIKSGLDIIF